jgi:hypothetical protein
VHLQHCGNSAEGVQRGIVPTGLQALVVLEGDPEGSRQLLLGSAIQGAQLAESTTKGKTQEIG